MSTYEMPASAIFVSDLHLTDVTPISRTDDYLAAQKAKLAFLQGLSDKNGKCPIICGGDVFDYWKGTPFLCNFAYNALPRPFITIPGQHDLPGHSLNQYDRSALALVEAVSNDITVLKGNAVETEDLYIVGMPFGLLDTLDVSKLPATESRRILILHALTWQGKLPMWDANGWTDELLAQEYGDYFDVILTGDNHVGFYSKKNGTHIVNPGSLMRKTADQVDHQPTCYLYYADTNKIVPVEIPVASCVLNRAHLEKKEAQEKRIQSYVEQMKRNWDVGVSFEHNLEAFFGENEVSPKVKELIYSSLEKEAKV